MHASDIFMGYGAKAMYDGSITEDFGMGGMIHVARTSERHADNDKLFDTSVYAKYQDHKFTVGYTQTGKKNGWGSFNKAGDNIVQFEEGDVMYERDVRTVYTMVSTKVQKLSIDAILGTTSYKLKGGDEKRYRQHEFSTWLSYPILENLSAIVKFDKTIKAQPYYPAMTQVSAGMS